MYVSKIRLLKVVERGREAGKSDAGGNRQSHHTDSRMETARWPLSSNSAPPLGTLHALHADDGAAVCHGGNDGGFRLGRHLIPVEP